MLSTRWEMTLVAPVSFYLARKTILVTSGEFLAELWSLNLFNEEIAEMLQATRPVLYAALERAKRKLFSAARNSSLGPFMFEYMPSTTYWIAMMDIWKLKT